LFAYGTYEEYVQKKQDLIELNAAQTYKLKTLSLLDEATKEKVK